MTGALTENTIRQRRLGRTVGQNENKYAMLGVAAAVCGTVAAVASIPLDPQPIGALFWPSLYCGCGLLISPILNVRGKPASLLRAENVLMFGLVYWILLDPLQGIYPLVGATYDGVAKTFMSIGTMACGIWLGLAGKGWRLPALVVQAVRQPLRTASLYFAVWASFILGISYFAYSSGFDLRAMFSALGEGRWSAPWSRGQFGGLAAFIEHLKYFGYALPSLTVLMAHRLGWMKVRVIVSAVLSFVIIMFLAQEGGRRVIGVIVGSALISWLLLQERIKPRYLFGGAIAMIILLVGMELMLDYRSTGFSAAFQGAGLSVEVSRVRVDDNFLRLTQIVELFPSSQPFVDLQPLYYLLTRPIPRFFWPGKPADPGYDLPSLLGMSGVSLSHSIIGELYAMQGFVAVFVGGLLFGRLSKMWNKILTIQGGLAKSMIYGLGIMTLLAAIRSMQDLLIMSYGVLAWLVISKAFPSSARHPARPE